MKRFLLALAAVAGLLVLAGCTDTTGIIQALSQDPANNCVRVTSVYGVIEMARLNGTGSSVDCGAIKMTKDTASGTINIPVQLNPVQLKVMPQ